MMISKERGLFFAPLPAMYPSRSNDMRTVDLTDADATRAALDDDGKVLP